MTDEGTRLAAVRLQKIRLRKEQETARSHPAYLMNHMSMPDEKTGERFRFHLTDPSSGWYWQREVLDELISEQKSVILKARQLGITWLCAAYQLASALLKPDTLHLVYRQKEDDAAEIIDRIWTMFESLPEHLTFGVTVITPRGGFRPHLQIEFRHPDGRISRIRGMASTSSAGHGQTVASILLDEGSRIEKLREIWTAITATVGTIGKVMVVSTANGVSDPSGAGNFYHRLWVTSSERDLNRIFLGWFKHPDRDQEWFDNGPETRALDDRERAEQYPGDADEAFSLTTDVYFNRDGLAFYGKNLCKPLYQGEFEGYLVDTGPHAGRRAARFDRRKRGLIRVFKEPVDDHKYAIGADVATGRGADSSAAYVIDLTDMGLVAEIHAKIDPDKFAFQLHFLGKFYNTARLAIETASGFGEAVIIPLRDGREGRPAYPKLHRLTTRSRPDAPEQIHYGFPINIKTRPRILALLNSGIRDKLFDSMPEDLHAQCKTFVHHETGTSPRAMTGCHDDCVMAAGIAMELYSQFGSFPERFRPKQPKRPKTPYPWLVA